MTRPHADHCTHTRSTVGVAPNFARMFLCVFFGCGREKRKKDQSVGRNTHHVADIANCGLHIPLAVRPMAVFANHERLQTHTFFCEPAAVVITPFHSPAIRIFVDCRYSIFPVHNQSHPSIGFHDLCGMLDIGGNAFRKNDRILKIRLPRTFCRVLRPEFLP